jgi:signal peptide peptidase SppA
MEKPVDPPDDTESGTGRSWRRRLNPKTWFKRGPLVPVLRFDGIIGAVTPLRPGLSLATTAAAIDKAFAMKGAKAIAVQINSPGGSPVQSTLIFRRLRALAEEKKMKIYVFAEDVAASGGYLLALAGDEIYADASSVLGSIGVVSASFGFHELINRIGVERRVYTAGANKVTLDPFQPEKPQDIERVKAIQQDIHGAFVGLVKERRGANIEKAGDQLFTGEFWSGIKALDLGLIDGLADLRGKMRELFGPDVRFKLVTARSAWPWRKPSVSVAAAGALRNFPAGLSDDLISSLEARAIWSRFGF